MTCTFLHVLRQVTSRMTYVANLYPDKEINLVTDNSHADNGMSHAPYPKECIIGIARIGGNWNFLMLDR